MEIYFDNAATTLLSKRASEEYIKTALLYSGNPSSIHRLGLKAKKELEKRREHIASILSIEPSSIIFTSGATEAISLFFQSLLWMEKGTIIISRIEHEAVSSWIPYLKKMGWNVILLKAKGGFVRPEDLLSSLTPDTKAVAIMSVNNTIGTIQPIKELVECTREYEKKNGRKILFFSDSVQALGKIDLRLKEWDIDGASFSGHKINGPRGIGFLYSKNPELIRPLAQAGGQERGKRGGTENLPAIASFDTALTSYLENREENEKRIREIKDYLVREITKIGLNIFTPQNSSPYILSVEAPLPSEVFTRMLMDKNICVSSGSACSNNSKGKTEGILEAMGIQNQSAKKAIRISMSNDTTMLEAEELIKALREIINEK